MNSLNKLTSFIKKRIDETNPTDNENDEEMRRQQGAGAGLPPPIGFEGLKLEDDRQSVSNTQAGFNFNSHFGNNRNPFDDPFFKNEGSSFNFPSEGYSFNFPSFNDFDSFDRPQPPRPQPPRPPPPSVVIPVVQVPSAEKEGGKGGGYKAWASGIISHFGELIEKNKSNESMKRNIVKEPKRFKDSFVKIVKDSHTDNYLPDQDYNTIKKRHSSNNPFTDTQFPAKDSSLFYTGKFANQLKNNQNIVWKRAKHLHDQPHFTIDSNGRHVHPRMINENNYKKFFHTTDLDQGALGNCWFISAACGIIQNYDLFRRVVPFDNSFESDEYTGAFRFRFWCFGEWKEVVVDDYLPVNSHTNQLLFCRNRDMKNEFWCALLEKAYAKICGNYEAMDGGLTTDALIDMSGGIEEEYDLKKVRGGMHYSAAGKNGRYGQHMEMGSLWEILVNARKKSSVIGANISVLATDYANEMRMCNGLVRGHAYIITKMAEIEVRGVLHKIMRIYNPWGNEAEWNGEWSDRSSIWRQIDQGVKEELELKIECDGEFWISFKDFVMNYDQCQICNLTPSTVHDITMNDWSDQRLLSSLFSMWQCQQFDGAWKRGINAGGCGNGNTAKYWTNPQFSFTITANDLCQGDTCWLIIGLMQKHTRKKRALLRIDSAEEYIQFRLLKVRDNANHSIPAHIESRDLERIDSSGAYINKREVTARFSLKEGTYVVIPSCYEEDKEGQFLVRIFTEKPLSDNQCTKLAPEAKVRASQGLGSSASASQRTSPSHNPNQPPPPPPPIGFIASDYEKIEVNRPQPNPNSNKDNCAQM